jgi:hypothetical protein
VREVQDVFAGNFERVTIHGLTAHSSCA